MPRRHVLPLPFPLTPSSLGTLVLVSPYASELELHHCPLCQSHSPRIPAVVPCRLSCFGSSHAHALSIGLSPRPSCRPCLCPTLAFFLPRLRSPSLPHYAPGRESDKGSERSCRSRVASPLAKSSLTHSRGDDCIARTQARARTRSLSRPLSTAARWSLQPAEAPQPAQNSFTHFEQ